MIKNKKQKQNAILSEAWRRPYRVWVCVSRCRTPGSWGRRQRPLAARRWSAWADRTGWAAALAWQRSLPDTIVVPQKTGTSLPASSSAYLQDTNTVPPLHSRKCLIVLLRLKLTCKTQAQSPIITEVFNRPASSSADLQDTSTAPYNV